MLSKEPTSLQLESSSLSVSSSLLTATTRSLSFYPSPDISLYLSLNLSEMSGAYLQQRADDQRLQIPDQSRRLGERERLPVLGQDRSIRLRFQQDRGQSEEGKKREFVQNSHKFAHNEPHRDVCGSLCKFKNVLFAKENKTHKSHTFTQCK